MAGNSEVDSDTKATTLPGNPGQSETSDIEATGNLKREIGLRFTILARLLRNNFDRQVAGLNVTRDGSTTWRSSIETWGEDLPLTVRLSQHWLQFSLDPFLAVPGGAAVPDAVRAELLRINRELRFVKFGQSEEGALVLTAELPTEHLELAEVMTVLTALATCVEEHRARFEVLLSAR